MSLTDFRHERASALRRRLLTAIVIFYAAATVSEMARAQDNGHTIEEMTIVQKHLMVKDDDIANAATPVAMSDIEAEGAATGSIETLLNMTPSVNAYTQGIGQNAPTLSVRGQNEQSLSLTVNGVPLMGLFGSAGGYLSNWTGVGGPLTLNEIAGAEVYAGVAPPDKQGFGTVGGTLAFTTREAGDQRSLDFNAGFGSFKTLHEGFAANTGKLFSDDADAIKAYLMYDQSSADGFIQATQSQYRNLLFNIIKPYEGGLGKVELTIIDNWGKGYVQIEPTPVPLQQDYGFFYNKPHSDGFYKESNNYLTVMLRDVTPINDNLIYDGTIFFQNQTSTANSWESPSDEESTYPANIYIPAFFYPCPNTPSNNYASNPQGCNAFNQNSLEQTVGFAPKLSYFLDTDWAHQEVTAGGLFGRSRSTLAMYEYGSIDMPESWSYNGLAYGGFQQRTVISGFFQDKIDLLDGTLHLLPGLREEVAYTSAHQIAYNGYLVPQIVDNWTHKTEPYYGVSYDLPKNVTAYASYGTGSLFAPLNSYSVGTNGTTNAPLPEAITFYEAGLKYNTPTLFLGADYYYQKLRHAFSSFTNFTNGNEVYGNGGREQFRGVEVSGRYKLPEPVLPGVSLFGNASFNQARYLATTSGFDSLADDQFGINYRGTPLSNVPEYLGNLGVEYDDGAGFLARLTAHYTGAEFITQDLTTGPACAAATYNASLCGLTYTDLTQHNPSNTIFNLLLSYRVEVPGDALKNVTLKLNIKNLLDKHYYTYYYSAENPAEGNIYGVEPIFSNGLVAAPRTLMGEISLHF